MSSIAYTIRYTRKAADMFAGLQRTARKQVAAKVDLLDRDPDSRGKALRDELSEFRSVIAAGRYRIIFHVHNDEPSVTVVAVGIRKEGDKIDVYKIATQLMNRGELLD